MTATLAKRTGDQCVSVTLPELLLLSKNAKELSLSSFLVKNTSGGHHMSRLFGRGMEFAECRRYLEGDDIRAIDWRVTARTGKVHTKLFAAEKERQVLICTDMRSPMYFATRGVYKSVQASLMTAHLAWSAVQGGNRLGGLIFNEAKQDEFRPAPGKRGVLPLLQQLVEHKRAGTGHDVSLDRVIQSIRRVSAPGSFIFFISDFREFSSAASEGFIQLSAHCDIVLCFIYDPLEAALPKNGLYPICNGGEKLLLSTYEKAKMENYQKQFLQRREAVASLGRYRHIHFLECSTEDDCFKILKEHFRVRKNGT